VEFQSRRVEVAKHSSGGLQDLLDWKKTTVSSGSGRHSQRESRWEKIATSGGEEFGRREKPAPTEISQDRGEKGGPNKSGGKKWVGGGP